MSDKILVVEDEANIARTVRLYLEQAGYQVVIVEDGALALPAFRRERPDLVVLDLMLPHVDGWEICRLIRQSSGVPIIMLTARSEETDRIVGLELGADDYIAKPFSPREVVARVRAVLRRTQGTLVADQTIRAADVVVDLERHEVSVAGRLVELTHHEFLLLATLVRYPGRVFSRLQLLDQIEESAYAGYERMVDQYIKTMRANIGDDARAPRYIATIYGVGYKFIEGTADDA